MEDTTLGERRRRILKECYDEAYRVIERDKARMQPIIDALLEEETLLGPQFNKLVKASG